MEDSKETNKTTISKLCLFCQKELSGRRRKYCSLSCCKKFLYRYNPTIKIKHDEYQKSEKYRNWLKEYNNTENRRLSVIKYMSSDKRKSYEKSENYRLSVSKWRNSSKGKTYFSNLKKTIAWKVYKRMKDWRRKSRIRNIIHCFTNNQWYELLMRSNGYCSLCNNNVGFENLTLDHIIPISKVKKGHIYFISDIQAVCMACNRIKGNKIIEEVICEVKKI